MTVRSATPVAYLYIIDERAPSPALDKTPREFNLDDVAGCLVSHEHTIDAPYSAETIHLTEKIHRATISELALIANQLHAQNMLSDKLKAYLFEQIEGRLSETSPTCANQDNTTAPFQSLSGQELLFLLWALLPYSQQDGMTSRQIQAELLRKLPPPNHESCKLDAIDVQSLLYLMHVFLFTDVSNVELFSVLRLQFLRHLKALCGSDLIRILYGFVYHNAKYPCEENRAFIAQLQEELVSKDDTAKKSKFDDLAKLIKSEGALLCHTLYYLSRQNLLTQRVSLEFTTLIILNRELFEKAFLDIQSLATLAISLSLQKKATKPLFKLIADSLNASLKNDSCALSPCLVTEVLIAFSMRGFFYMLNVAVWKSALVSKLNDLQSLDWLFSLQVEELMALFQFLQKQNLINPEFLQAFEKAFLHHAKELLANRQETLSFILDNRLYSLLDSIIEMGFDLDSQLPDGTYPIHMAVEENDTVAAVKILKRKVALDVFNQEGKTALQVACFLGYSRMAHLLITYGANVHAASKNEKLTAFQFALRSPLWKTNPSKIISFFNDFFSPCGAVVDALNLHGQNFIQFFIEHPEYLLDASRNERDANPLELAYCLQDVTLAFNVVSNMPDEVHLRYLDELTTKYGQPSAHLIAALYLRACQQKNSAQALAVIRRTNEVDYVFTLADNDQRSFLHIATFRNMSDVVMELLKKKCDPNMQDKKGYTALHYAYEFGFGEIATLLLANRANPAIVNAEMKTAFQVAHPTLKHTIPATAG